MHPYFMQAIADERAADAIRAADASRRALDAEQVVAVRAHRARPARRAFRRQPGSAGLAVSGSQCL